MGILSKINLTHVIIILILVVNLVLVSILFYMVVPTLSPTTNPQHAGRIVNSFLENSTADAVVFWAVNLESNTRRSVAHSVRDPRDADGLERFITAASLIRFTSAITPEITKALLSGNGMCYTIASTGITAIGSVFDIVKDYPQAMACVIPNKNSSGILNSYALLIWKQTLTPSEQEVILNQGQAIMQNTK